MSVFQCEINFIGLSGLAYNQDQAATYVQCNLVEETSGLSKLMQTEITGFTSDKTLDCQITMRMSSSLRPGSIFTQTVVMQWKEIAADGNGVATSEKMEWESFLRFSFLFISLSALNFPIYFPVNAQLSYLFPFQHLTYFIHITNN